MRPRVALVSARAARGQDEDFAPLAAALAAQGMAAELAEWDEPGTDWAAFELAVLRSSWDYAERLAEFLAWAERVSRLTVLLNPLTVIRWNTDKHYLRELAAAGVPTVPTTFIEPGESAARALAAFLAREPGAELVVKPAVGAGSRDAARYRRGDGAATAHAARLLEAGRSVMLQPYLDPVDRDGETALIHFGGRFSHAIRKGPLLTAGGGGVAGLFAPEHISPRTPSAAQLDVAQRALAAVPFPAALPYARVDLLGSPDGRPLLLELELTEPSLFLAHAPGAAARLAAQLRDQLPLASR